MKALLISFLSKASTTIIGGGGIGSLWLGRCSAYNGRYYLIAKTKEASLMNRRNYNIMSSSPPKKKHCTPSAPTTTTFTAAVTTRTTSTQLQSSSSSTFNNIFIPDDTMTSNHNHDKNNTTKSVTTTTTSSTQCQKSKWTICFKCLGEGKIPSRMTKKAKYQKKKLQQEQQQEQQRREETGLGTNDNVSNVTATATATATNPSSSSPTTTKVMKNCNACSGTGLLRSSSSSMTKQVPIHPNVHVGIIGGGIGGLALALALQHRNIPYTIYEKDINFDERKQGYGLTMQQGSQALLALGLFDDNHDDNDHINNPNLLFGKGIHSKRHIVHEPNGKVVGEWGLKVWGRPKSKQNRDAKRQNAHIQRQELRRIFYDQIENKEERIKWGHKLVCYSNSSGACRNDNNDDDNADGGHWRGERGIGRYAIGNDSSDDYSRDGDCSERISMTFQVRNDESILENNSYDIKNNKMGENDSPTTLVNYTSTILVGADGIRSAVRKQKIGEENTPLRYLGCIVVLGITSSPQSSTLTSDGETVFQTADGTTRIYAMPFSRMGQETANAAKYIQSQNQVKNMNAVEEVLGETMWQLSFPMTEDDANALSSKGPKSLKEEALRRCGSWHDPIPEMILTTPDELISGYPVYDRGDILSHNLFRYGFNSGDNDDDCNMKKSDCRVTMIGDAGHPMSPFKGQGANQAILDAIELARSLHKVFRLEKPRGTLEEALNDFESSMLKRSAVKIKASAEAAQFLHSDIAIMKGNITRAAAAAQQSQDEKCSKDNL